MRQLETTSVLESGLTPCISKTCTNECHRHLNCTFGVVSALKKKWLIWTTTGIAITLIALFFVGRAMTHRFEPYIRQQAIAYLQDRFDSEVELGSLQISIPHLSPYKLVVNRGRGTRARVQAEDVVLRHKRRRDIAPMFVMKRFSFEVDLGTLFDTTKRIQLVTVDGMEINVPPQGERPDLGDLESDTAQSTNVLFDEVLINDSRLNILPRDRTKKPLQFDLHWIRLQSAGKYVAMKYDAILTNAMPPGKITSTGNFGPWVADEPGDSPLKGTYVFDKADLGVFKGIAGILHSTGQFEGTLDSINAKGEATVPDFRLKHAGNPVSLKTNFEVLVDGTNGNTVLKPVVGTLGKTTFTTSGTVLKHEEDTHRTISLDVSMPKGDLRDLLRVAMKGEPFMEGQIALKTKIVIPPLTGTVKEKLILDAQFDIPEGKFLKSTIQDQIDTLSRRGQGQPQNMEIDEVVLRMGGVFHLEDQKMTLKSLAFAVPGSGVDLKGDYDLDGDALDLHGTLRLDAKVSQTLTGWKRWLAKPLDPFFSKEGAGTLLHIQVTGSSKAPKFGRDKGPKSNPD
jgi:hypothetical protein